MRPADAKRIGPQCGPYQTALPQNVPRCYTHGNYDWRIRFGLLASTILKLSAIINAALPGVIFFALFGCRTDAVTEEATRQVEAATLRAAAVPADPMGPMIGFWTINVEATLEANSILGPYILAAIREDLTLHPFELEITDHSYVSRSSVKVNDDRYSVVRVDSENVTISLEASDGVEEDGHRIARLRIRDRRLVITNESPFNEGPFITVLSRSIH